MASSNLSNAGGLITDMWFSGEKDQNHADVVQIYVANGISVNGCHSSLAAIRNTESNQHLISFALAAYISKQPVTVVVDSTDTYFVSGTDSRCTISRISTANKT